MLVRDVMTRAVVTVQPTDQVSTAATKMRSLAIRHLLVVAGNQLVGILSENDIPRIIKAQLFVLDIMSVNPVCIEASDKIEHARATMSRHQIASLPVLDRGRLVGIVTISDVT